MRRLIFGAASASILFCLFLALPAHLFAARPAPQPPVQAASQPALQQTPLAGCQDGLQESGAAYRICMPPTWNGDLVVYAHGYVAPNRPPGIPEDQLELPGGGRIDAIITGLGYAFATTGYSTNGLAVIPAQADLLDLVDVFTREQGPAGRVLLAGVSEGGLIAMLLAERSPRAFDGVLALCGPYGDFRRQVDYVGDFRVLFDYYFPNLLPPTPVDIPEDLLDDWESTTYSTTIKPILDDPANSAKLDELLKVAAVPYDPLDPLSRERSVERVLWYNIYGTNDATAKLGGQPFDNQLRQYSGSGDDTLLNSTVQRFTAAGAALDSIAASYQTSGRLRIPVITLHTTSDPVVPFWHQDLYTAKVEAAGAGALYEHYPVTAYGHCSFTSASVLTAFGRLLDLVDQAITPRLYLPALGNNQPETSVRRP
jgi:pimeloyl-ACP methyl ester carboxylesterase